MQLETVREALKKQVNTPETNRHFRQACCRRAALRPFRCAQEAVAFLNESTPGGRRARSAVTGAMIAEVKQRKASCWSAMLIVAYFPGLYRIRGAISCIASMEDQELDALVIECFLEVAGTFPLETQGRLAVVNLVLGTRKRILEQLREEVSRMATLAPLDNIDEERMWDPAASPEDLMVLREERHGVGPEQVRDLVRDLCKDEPEDDLLLVLGTYASGKPLITFVREQCPGVGPRELRRQYERCRRRRSRLINKLRSRIRAISLSHSPINPALLKQEAC